MIDLPNDHSLISLDVFKSDGQFILASKDGRGFIVASEDLIAQTKTGKQVLNIKEGEKSVICKKVQGSDVVSIGKNKKMLIFPINDLPKMSKGRGVRIQKYKDSEIMYLDTFNSNEGLIVEDKSGRKRTFENTSDWLGKRAQSGKLVPKGFPKLN